MNVKEMWPYGPPGRVELRRGSLKPRRAHSCRQRHLGLRLLLLLLRLALGGATLRLDVLVVDSHGLVNLELQSIRIIDTVKIQVSY